MANKLTRAARAFFTPEAILPFLIGSMALGVLSNAAFTLLANWLGQTSRGMWQILAGSAVVLVLMVWLFSLFVARYASAQLLPGKKRPDRHRGLILLVSNADVCRKAIDFHAGVLERVWLVCSQRTLEAANGLRGAYPAVTPDEPVVINDVYDLQASFDAVNGIYKALPGGWKPEEVIADFTGMTVPVSVGLVLACLRTDRRVQYVPAEYDTELKALRPGDPIEVTFPPGSRPVA